MKGEASVRKGDTRDSSSSRAAGAGVEWEPGPPP